MLETLYTKYRPKDFDEVIGQDAVVKSLRSILAADRAHTFLFHGPSGTGKTTLARICSSELGCAPSDIFETNAAKFTGVDDMRAITDALRFAPLGGKKTVRSYIIDECHMLSKSAWNSLLKDTEEPPGWVYWFFCTTDPGRVPQTIQTRSTKYGLKPVPTAEIRELLADIAKKEGIGGKLRDSLVDLCAKEAHGSPRAALVALSACAAVGSLEDARDLLKTAEDSPDAANLAKLLIQRRGWADVRMCLEGLKAADTNPESVRHVVQSYVAAAIMGASKPDPSLFAVLESFSTMFPQGDGMAPLILACGKLVFGNA